MERAWILGRPAALDAAVAEAANLIAASTNTLIAGLGTDVAGARAALALAERTGAVVDHMHSQAALRDLDVMQSSGVMMTTPTECRVRADTLLLVGPIRGPTRDQLLQNVIGNGQVKQSAPRRIIWLCPGRDLLPLTETIAATPVGRDLDDLPVLLATLRAEVAGRPTAKTGASSKMLQQAATTLKQARFGAAIWSGAEVDSLVIEMLCGLVDDLNATTRFSSLPLAPGADAIGVMQVCGWTTGLPMRISFGRGFWQHDPWLFDGHRLVASGEVDCVIWISAYGKAVPAWGKTPTTIALTAQEMTLNAPAQVHIVVGDPGVDHSAVQYFAATGTLAAFEATRPSATITVAAAIERIAAAIPERGAR
ncbi:MAG: tungsten formylmethanofuran dehydrogenase [Xanthobacteraceae bacterium]